MSNARTQLAAFKPLRVSCAWIPGPAHEDLLTHLASTLPAPAAWMAYVYHRAGNLSRVAALGRTWVQKDVPTFGSDTLHMEVISLSAN